MSANLLHEIEAALGAQFETGLEPEPDDLVNLCRCGCPRSFHAEHLGCSGSHDDSMPCMTFNADA